MRQTVTTDLSDSKADEKDIAVDTTPANEEEKNVQDEVVKAMETDQPVTVSEPEAEKSDEEVETPPADEEKSEEEKPEESAENYGKVIDTEVKEENSEKEKNEEEKKSEEKVDLEKIKAEAEKKAFDDFVNKFKPNDQKSENIRLYKQNQELQEKLKEQDTGTYLATEKQKDIYQKFCDSHKDIIPENSKQNLIAYQTIGDENLITNDEVLFKLDKELKKIAQVNPDNPLIDLNDRLEAAYWLAFKDKIMENKTKQTQVQIEMEKQETDKMVEDGSKPTTPIKKKSYSAEQLKVADAWGVTDKLK